MTLDEFTSKAMSLPVPFKELGRDYDGWDCWGLCVRAYKDILGTDIPDYVYNTTNDFRRLASEFRDRESDHWRSVEPKPMAIAVIYRRSLPIHAGLILSRNRVLHIEHGIDTVIEPMNSFRIEGFYAPSCGTAPV